MTFILTVIKIVAKTSGNFFCHPELSPTTVTPVRTVENYEYRWGNKISPKQGSEFASIPSPTSVPRGSRTLRNALTRAGSRVSD
jgi:hypothetical protein